MKLRTKCLIYFGLIGLLPFIFLTDRFFLANDLDMSNRLYWRGVGTGLFFVLVALALVIWGLAYLFYNSTINRIETLNEFLKNMIKGKTGLAKADPYHDEISELRQTFIELYQCMETGKKELEDNNRKLSFINMSLEEKYAQSYTVKFIQEEIGRELDTNQLLRKTADVVMGVLGSSRCAIYMFDPENEELLAKADSGFVEKRQAAKKRIPVTAENIIAKSWHDGKIYTESDAGPSELQEMVERGSRRLLTIPLNGRENCLGVMVIEHESAVGLSWDLIEFGQTIARELSLSFENAFLYGRMQQMAIHDGLTGVYNRMYLMNYLTELFNKQPQTISLIILDLDHFKKINDRFGHLNGDSVLKETCLQIQKLLSKGILARYGGEEFVVVLPEINPAEAYALAETIKETISNHRFATKDGKAIPVTLSAGLASYPKMASGQEELLQLADEALYQAKFSGRNRVNIYGKN